MFGSYMRTGRLSRRPVAAPPPSNLSIAALGARINSYARQFETNVSVGQMKPTTPFGSPSLVWHVALWPRRYLLNADGTFAKDSNNNKVPCDPHDTANHEHEDARTKFVGRRDLWIAHINGLLKRLQGKSRWRRKAGVPIKIFHEMRPHDIDHVRNIEGDNDFFEPFDVLESEALGFTLWWRDPEESDDEIRDAGAIRVRVQAELNADFATLTFFMDIDQMWNLPHGHRSATGDAIGRRRAELLKAVDEVRTICEAQLKPLPGSNGAAGVDQPQIPEFLVSPDNRSVAEIDAVLLNARNLLYVDIWEAFCNEVCGDGPFGLQEIAGSRGEVFHSARGAIMWTDGQPGGTGAFVPTTQQVASLGSVPFPNFSNDPRFNADGPEPNATIKAFLPFIRRITPGIDYREAIVCGVMNWRALYITTLGSRSQFDSNEEHQPAYWEKDETDIRVPNADPGEEGRIRDGLVCKRQRGATKADGAPIGNNHPERFLVITKRAPNARQVGRIVERLNAMGTMRLFALKDWSALRDADPRIRILGQDLDRITKDWSRKRVRIHELNSLTSFRAALRSGELPEIGKGKMYVPWRITAFLNRIVHIPLLGILAIFSGQFRHFLWNYSSELISDMRHQALYLVSDEVEDRLIDLSAKLDQIGAPAVGGPHFRINRSAYYVREFRTLLDTLNVGNIQTWIAYDQLIKRGLDPAFDYIADVGERLRKLRDRLLTVTEMIETTVLVSQSAATRHNTAILRRATVLIGVALVMFVLSDWAAILKALKNVWIQFGFISEGASDVLDALRRLSRGG